MHAPDGRGSVRSALLNRAPRDAGSRAVRPFSEAPARRIENESMQPPRPAAWLRIFLLLGCVCTGLLLLVMAVVRREQHVLLGGEIVHDDFGFRIESVQSFERLGPGALEPRGRFVVVHLEILNRAKRVPFQLDGWTPVLFDSTGAVHEPDGLGQAALQQEQGDAARLAGALGAGATITKVVAYDVPRDARDLRFKVHWGIAPVNLLEDLVFGEKDIALGSTGNAGELPR